MNGEGQLFCSDIDSKRIELGKSRTEDLKLPIKWSCKDASIDLFPDADFILIDAPCTGTGIIGRKVDIRWRRKKDVWVYRGELLLCRIPDTCSVSGPDNLLKGILEY